MKFYENVIIFDNGYRKLPKFFAINFKSKSQENKFWHKHSTTYSNFKRFYLSELKGEFYKKVKKQTLATTKKGVIDELKINSYNWSDLC